MDSFAIVVSKDTRAESKTIASVIAHKTHSMKQVITKPHLILDVLQKGIVTKILYWLVVTWDIGLCILAWVRIGNKGICRNVSSLAFRCVL